MSTPGINLGGLSAVSSMDFAHMDIDSIMMMVQTQRANLLESELKNQIGSVQAKNDQISKLNQALGQLNSLSAQFPSDAKAGDKVDNIVKANDYQMEKEINSSLKEAGVAPFTQGKEDWSGRGRTLDNSVYNGGLGGNTTKGQVDAAIQQLKSNIDSLSNSQQMDMLRLQSLSNKRNEAFDLMTNFVKKMQDNRNTIIGNMR